MHGTACIGFPPQIPHESLGAWSWFEPRVLLMNCSQGHHETALATKKAGGAVQHTTNCTKYQPSGARRRRDAVCVSIWGPVVNRERARELAAADMIIHVCVFIITRARVCLCIALLRTECVWCDWCKGSMGSSTSTPRAAAARPSDAVRVSASHAAVPRGATATPVPSQERLLALTQEVSTRLQRVRARLKPLHGPFPPPDEIDQAQQQKQQQQQQQQQQQGADAGAGAGAGAGSGGGSSSASGEEDKPFEPPSTMSPLDIAVGKLHALSENVVSHLLVIRPKSAVHSRAWSRVCVCVCVCVVCVCMCVIGCWLCVGLVCVFHSLSLSHCVPHDCLHHYSFIHSGKLWFEHHSYCELCNTFSPTPCNWAYARAMSCMTMSKAEDVPANWCSDVLFTRFIMCWQVDHRPYFEALAKRLAAEEAAEQGATTDASA